MSGVVLSHVLDTNNLNWVMFESPIACTTQVQLRNLWLMTDSSDQGSRQPLRQTMMREPELGVGVLYKSCGDLEIARRFRPPLFTQEG